MRRKLFGSTAVLVLLVALAQPAAAAIQKVRDTTAREYGFTIDRNLSNEIVRAWAQDSAQHPYRYQIWWQAEGDPAARLTPLGTTASVGSLDLDNPDGALLSYDVYNRQARNWEVKLYDLVADHPVGLPAGVNTNAQDTHPTISGNNLLFMRWNRQGTSRVLLVDMTTGAQVQLAGRTNGLVLADQVNGDWVVYTVCPGANNRCVVHRYQISTQTDIALPNANRAAYAPTVDDAGNVYYVIGHPTRCGVNTQLHHWTGGPGAPKIEQFRNRTDVPTTWAYELPDTSIDVHFTRIVCQPSGNFRSGIYLTDG